MSSKGRQGKVAVMGASGVGKTSLVERFLLEYWSPSGYCGGSEYECRKRVVVDDVTVELEVLDCAGTEQFTAMRDLYVKNSHIVLLCFSLVDKASLSEVLTVHYSNIREVSPETIVFLVGLKMDLVVTTSSSVVTSVVTVQEAVSMAKKMNAYGYFQCSSKLQVGVQELFDTVARVGVLTSSPIAEKPKKTGWGGGFWSWFSFNNKDTHPSTPTPGTPATPPATAPSHLVSTVSNSQQLAHKVTTVTDPNEVLLPSTLWIAILEYLDIMSLIRVSRTCRHLYNLTKTEPLFTTALHRGALFPKGFHWKNPIRMYNTSDKIITLKPFEIYDQRRVHRSSSNAGTVCFGPNATILLSNGTECPMKELKVGDKVATSTPSSTISNLSSQTSLPNATVTCIWRCPVKQAVPMVVVKTGDSSVLEITTDHPIHILISTGANNNQQKKWCLPTLLQQPRMIDNIGCVYNLVTTSTTPCISTSVEPVSVVVGGVECCTLGMSVPGHEDPFWGSHRVINWLSSRTDFPNVVASPPTTTHCD